MEHFDYSALPGKTLHHRYRTENICPLISVITPYFNAGKYFEGTFNSVLNQTLPYFEWIIVDDDSTDEQDVASLDALAALDSRITVHHRVNELRRKTGRSYGASASRNYGASVANTQYLLFLDADDLADPVFFETMYLALHLEQDAGWAYSDIVNFGDKDLLWRREYSSDLMKTENLHAPDCLVRKSMFDDIGGFATMEGRYFNEDWHFWLLALAKGYRPVHVAQYLFWYRNLSGGVLGAIKRDEEATRVNAQIIAEAASHVPSGVKAIEYFGAKRKDWAGVETWPDVPALPFAQEKTHILFLLPHLFMGGADNFNLEFIKRLDRDKYDITLVTTLPEDNEWQHLFAPYADDIFAIPFLFDMQQWPAFIDYLMRSRGISLVFCTNSYYGYFLLPWLRARYPSVAMVDYVHMEEWYYRGGGYARTAGDMGGILDKTYVCNENTRRVILEHFHRAPESVETVYIGVDEKQYNPDDAANKMQSTAPSNVPDVITAVLPQLDRAKPMILFPCRIVAQKRPFLMLEIAKRLPQYSFVVVGDGLQEDELRAAVTTSGVQNVLFAGRQSDMRPWYKAASLTLICSLREGLSLTAYESLSMATPVVTSDTGGQAELVNSSVGAVIPLPYAKTLDEDNRDFADEAPLYAQAIAQLLSDSAAYKAMCAACRARILEGFTLDGMARKLTAQLEALLTPDAAAQRAQQYAALAPLTQLFANHAELFADYDSLDRRFFFSDGSYHYYKERFEQEGYPAAQELARLQQTRSYRVAMAYQRIVGSSAVLKTLRHWLGAVKRLLRRGGAG